MAIVCGVRRWLKVACPAPRSWQFKATLLGLLVCLAVVYPQPTFAGGVTLTWDANTEGDLAGYRVYVGTASGEYGPPIDVGDVTNYTVTLKQIQFPKFKRV